MEMAPAAVVTIDGDDAKVGFDGEDNGIAVLRLEDGSELRMIADGSGFATIEEFRSGAHDSDTPDVLSAFDMGEGTLLIDIGAIAGGAAREEVLVDTDQIVGMFDDVEFIGLGANQDATLTVDYETDKVTVASGPAGQGSGKINVATVGNMLNAAEDAEIWDALTEGQGTYEEATRRPPSMAGAGRGRHPGRLTPHRLSHAKRGPPKAPVLHCHRPRSAAGGQPVLQVPAQRLGHAGTRQDHPAPPRLELHALDDLPRVFRPCSAV
jgi:hypothetical protein